MATPVEADITIIGAGIAGASLAGQLARFCSVTLLDMETAPGYHATGRSAAYFAPSYGSEVVRQVTSASESFFRHPPEGFTDVALLSPRSALFVARESQTQDLDELIRSAPDCERLDAHEIKGLVPAIREDVISGGMLDVGGGDLDVDAILQAFLRRMRGFGGQLVTAARVTCLNHHNGRWIVQTRSGNFSSRVIVNAAGAWADDVAQLAGLQPLGLTPKRRTAVLVDAPDIRGVNTWPLTIDVDEQFYFKPEAGQLLISPADETPSPPMDAFPDEMDMALGIDRVQQVADIPVTRVNHQWAGLRTFAPDKNFVSGFDPRADGFYWLAGQGGYGVQSCPAMAEIATWQLCAETNWLEPKTAEALGKMIWPDRLLV